MLIFKRLSRLRERFSISRLSRRKRSGARLGDFAAEENVRRYVEIVGQGEVLIDGLDAEVLGVARVRDLHRLAFEKDRAAVPRHRAREDLDQGRLARSVVANERMRLAAVDVEINASQRLHAPIMLADPPHFDDGLFGLAHVHASC